MQFSLFTVLLAALTSTVFAAPYPITTDTLHCRDKPSTSGKIVRTYTKSADIKITCQTYGTDVNGNNIWDKTKEGCYVSDYYVKTGVNGFLKDVPKCPGTKPPAKVPGPRTDDYKYKSSCSGVDPWKYYKCQCTSFVAQRLNERVGVKFHNMYKGVNWGNANTWDEAARRTNVKINGTPKPGAVAQTNAGRWGHVAYVSAVDGDYVIVEEYNYGGRERYGTRRVKKSQFNYIHLSSST